jgi:hypothetical protein
MISVKYLCALLAGMVLALGAFSVGVETATPLVADDDPFAVFAGGTMAAQAVEPQRFDDGLRLAGGAFMECPPVQTVSVVVAKPRVVVSRPAMAKERTWWTRGPVRRVISYPVRALCGRAGRAGWR